MRHPRVGRGPDIDPRDMPFWGLLPLWVVGAWVWFHAIAYPYWYRFGADSIAYYVTRHHWEHLYWLPPLADGAYLYSPTFAQAIWPLTWLPWDLFRVVWGGVEVAALIWLLKPLGRRWAVPLLIVATGLELPLENVYPFLAVAAVLGMRRPAAWAFPILTKVTPGVGALWFAARGEWRRFAAAVAATAAVVAVSVLLAPRQWSEWINLLSRGGALGYFAAARYVIAVVLIAWGARAERRWVIPLAMLVATPVWSAASPVILAAVPRLARRADEARGNAVDGTHLWDRCSTECAEGGPAGGAAHGVFPPRLLHSRSQDDESGRRAVRIP